LKVLKKLNISYAGYFTLKGYKHLDEARVTEAERYSTPTVKKRRKVLRAPRKKNIAILENKEDELHKSGGF
jgi:hypothetical protein